ncbi:ABC transporter ATP-binding protein [Engelhardtia mirabilis]|uniref:Multidrug resistance-like ATP-binding protein MdlB n=1 Tax=Engelhardtia mirabilis TaxID=2528011 RepID=A0A518BRA6_9BACT|nr:putative ABC transporter ATP-binding protein [Planctomycetes bacterium Pla133]QDV03830.1 putative ABC transporter ATP-binding protein [Planctomycetes bacterium Pla86]
MSAPRREYDPEVAGKKSAFELTLLKRLWVYVHPQRWKIAESLALLLFNQLCRLAQPTLIALALDRYLLDAPIEGNWSKVVDAWDRFAQWALVDLGLPLAPYQLLLATFAFSVVLEFVARRRQVWLLDLAGQNALLDLRLALFRHLQRLSSSFYDRTAVGRLVGRATTDVEALAEMFSSGVVTILGDFVNIAAMTAVLLWLSWPLALVCFLMVPVLLGLTLWVRHKVRACYDVLVTRRSAMSAFLHERLVGMALVQSFVQEAAARSRFGEFNVDMRDAQLVAVRWESILSALVELIGSLTTALILWYGGSLVLDGLGLSIGEASPAAQVLTIGTLFMFIDYMTKFFEPLTDLSLKYTVMQNAMTAAAKIFRLMDVDEILPEPAEPKVPAARMGRVEFKGVSFSYNGRPEEDVLHGIDLVLEPGEHVAVVGATGSGKSTLMKLLTRLYEVREGAVLLDGVDVRDYAGVELRTRVGVVPQEVLLFEGSVVDNLRLGHPEVSDQDAIAAGQRLHLDQIVGRFASGWYEQVQERGKNLSSGERQLLAFARALAVAPEIVVLDEATSNVDTATEELLTEALHELLAGRTAMIIAHRLSTVREADRVIVMESGRIVENGSHAELLAKRGHYWRLHQSQFGRETA